MKFPKLPDGPATVGSAAVRDLQQVDATGFLTKRGVDYEARTKGGRPVVRTDSGDRLITLGMEPGVREVSFRFAASSKAPFRRSKVISGRLPPNQLFGYWPTQQDETLVYSTGYYQPNDLTAILSVNRVRGSALSEVLSLGVAVEGFAGGHFHPVPTAAEAMFGARTSDGSSPPNFFGVFLHISSQAEIGGYEFHLPYLTHEGTTYGHNAGVFHVYRLDPNSLLATMSVGGVRHAGAIQAPYGEIDLKVYFSIDNGRTWYNHPGSGFVYSGAPYIGEVADSITKRNAIQAWSSLSKIARTPSGAVVAALADITFDEGEGSRLLKIAKAPNIYSPFTHTHTFNMNDLGCLGRLPSVNALFPIGSSVVAQVSSFGTNGENTVNLLVGDETGSTWVVRPMPFGSAVNVGTIQAVDEETLSITAWDGFAFYLYESTDLGMQWVKRQKVKGAKHLADLWYYTSFDVSEIHRLNVAGLPPVSASPGAPWLTDSRMPPPWEL